jgi:hypothetical protein
VAISTIRSFTLVLALAAGVPVMFAAQPDRKEAQARIVEEEKYPCVNCFFGTADYFFCFQADSQILVARDKIRSMNWTDGNRNYLGKVHKSWKIPTTAGDSVKIEYDEKHVWIPRGDGKQIRMNREVEHNPFTNAQCRGAVKTASGD